MKPNLSRPSTNVPNGHDERGRFAVGNKFGTGNPNAKRTAEIKQMFLDCVTDADLKKIIGKIVSMAKSGDLQATEILFNRLLGRPHQSLEIESATPPHEIIVDIRSAYSGNSLLNDGETVLSADEND